ncbi:hypothetical protein HC752_09515 [Vibrio sp. S9_S30]|uniref:hypothetical protein n=1 Tax=Vibrio sp. S9_S30 TaxID=2720226 RepID=UPI0016803F99|nr:hypothetical protein [Vibrio sp. S9_S30]MBD1557178.1 hypothetical protein [Vibrio sp. S9_S30]
MKLFVIALFTLSFLSGCQLTRVEGEIDDVEVKVGTKDSNESNGKFCPPGQAKKGKC